MTNQQAITLLRNLEQSLDDYCELNDEGKTAFSKAITALELFGNSEQLPSAQANTSNALESLDCIDRQAALDALKRAEALTRAFGYHYVIDTIQELPSAQPEYTIKMQESDIDEAVKLVRDARVTILPSAQPEPHWIPCSERLPERGEDVLVTRDYNGREDNNKSCRYVEVASCYGEDEDITWNSYSDEYKKTPKNHRVVAWMPLPEPYKEEKA